MSRIGKLPIIIPSGVEVNLTGSLISVKGPQGTLNRVLPAVVKITKEKNHLTCSIAETREKSVKSLFGLVRSLVANMVQGVSKGYSKELEVHGIGYKVKQEGTKVTFNVGYSHPVTFEPPKEVKLKVEMPPGAPIKVIVTGIDKELVGQVAANIRAIKPPQVYKGNGVRYVGEKVRIKEGKKLAA